MKTHNSYFRLSPSLFVGDELSILIRISEFSLLFSIFGFFYYSIRGRSQMTSCKNCQFLPPSLPSVMVRHYCLDPPSEQKMTTFWPVPPFELFQLFYAYNYIYISVSPSFKIINAMDLKMNLEASTHYGDVETRPMTVVLVAPATSLSIHQVLLAPLQVGANLQI